MTKSKNYRRQNHGNQHPAWPQIRASPKIPGITKEERKVIFASSLGTVFRMVRLLPVRFAGRHHRQAVLYRRSDHHLHFRAAGLCRRLHRASIRRAGVRPPRRHDRPQVHLPGHHPDHGRVDLHCRPAARLCQIGIAAPIILVTLRILQGLALGGEYGGAATYVAEHAPKASAASFTAWIQTTATLGLFLSLLVILGTRTASAKPPSKPGAGACRSWCRCCCWAFRCGSACR
jgi:hypothetical protein